MESMENLWNLVLRQKKLILSKNPQNFMSSEPRCRTWYPTLCMVRNGNFFNAFFISTFPVFLQITKQEKKLLQKFSLSKQTLKEMIGYRNWQSMVISDYRKANLCPFSVKISKKTPTMLYFTSEILLMILITRTVKLDMNS